MKKRLTFYIDIDNTIYNSTKAVVDILNKKYGTNKNYEDVKDYGFKDLFPDVKEEEIQQIFSEENFYKKEDCVNRLAFAVMSLLYKMYNARINFVTLGTISNLENKKDWIDNVFDRLYIEYNEYYGSSNNLSDKSFVDMSDGVFIDDNIECLRSSNAKIKILLKNGVDTHFNEIEPNEDIYVVNDWNDIYLILDFYCTQGELI